MYTCFKCTKQVPVLYSIKRGKGANFRCEQCTYPAKCKHCKRDLPVPSWDTCDFCVNYNRYKKGKTKLKTLDAKLNIHKNVLTTTHNRVKNKNVHK